MVRGFVALGVLAAASPSDERRARTRTPGPLFRGHDFGSVSATLNGHLLRLSPSFEACESFSLEELRRLALVVIDARDEALVEVYETGDGRVPRFRDAAEVAAHHAALAPVGDADRAALRDGLCHEVVMWLVHHVAEDRRGELLAAPSLRFPLLPAAEPAAEPSPAARAERNAQVSCQQCHTGKVEAKWANATLPPPLPAAKVPGLERRRVCDYQYVPPCGPCEGLGGPRTGDGVDDFVPMACEPVEASGDPVVAAYPRVATASLAGDTRSPVAAFPAPGATYENLSATLMLGWEADDSVMRYRYNFSSAVQIYLQTAAQRAADDAGAMVTIARGLCACVPAIAGVVHVDAFAHDAYDKRPALPGPEGGLEYLGRVRVSLDDGSGRVAVADHYMKWAFHFLVDVDSGLPLRLYGPYGVRQVFKDWDLDADPVAAGLFDVPAHCLLDGDACHYFANRPRSRRP